ncbi:hypothetical protein K457DRAFT_1860889 [Linnemannia elongata AG-77]|uniref:Uncharacterized protein n=1 Tax=Linnemannia elongata AG-77 TaxID=1314771 RepID=A0A197KCS4_9FUNG|nr:hypothetical protein K457DRAFT_1860889 [Linnemannia elongata AG-77]
MAYPSTTLTPSTITAIPISSSGQGPGVEHEETLAAAVSGAGAGLFSGLKSPGGGGGALLQGQGPFFGGAPTSTATTAAGGGGLSGGPTTAGSGQGQLAQMLQQQQQQQQQAHQLHHGSTSNSVASLSSTIAASGLVLLPPPPLTFKNLTIHTSLLSTKQQLLQQQQQLQQLHHAQLNTALKKQQLQQQQQQKQQQQLMQQQQQQPGLSMEDCSPSALSEETGGEGERDCSKGAGGGSGHDSTAAISPSQSASLSTTRVTSPIPGTFSASGLALGGKVSVFIFILFILKRDRLFSFMRGVCGCGDIIVTTEEEIEEPPTFYEGMDDHPPVETDNDDNDSFFLDDRDKDSRDTDEATFFPLTKPHPSSKQQQQQRLQQHSQQQTLQQQTTKTTVAGDAINFNHHHHHDHEYYSQEFLQSPEQDGNNSNQQELQGQHQYNDHMRHQFHRLSNSTNDHLDSDHHSAIESTPFQRDLLMRTATATIHSQEPLDSNKSKANGNSVLATTTTAALPVAATTTVVSSSKVSNNGQTNELHSALSQSAVQPLHITAATNSSHEDKPRPRSKSRSTASGAWSRTMSESLIRKEHNLLHQQPSSFPSAKARPSILTRGFSADSKSRQDHEQRASQIGNGSTTGSTNRKATAKERFVALVTRSNGASTPVQNSKDAHGASGADGSSPLKGGGGRRGSADDRSPILAQTHHRRQGSPSLSRTGRMEFSTPTASSASPPAADTNLGFPYNNSSLLMSSDFARTTNTNKSSTLRPLRGNGKPRPFSVATMEKLMSSNSHAASTRGSGSRQEASRQEKQNGAASADRLEISPNDHHHAHHHHSHSNSGIGLHHHQQHRHSSVPMTSHSKGQEHGSLQSRMVSSGSYPLLTSFGTPAEASMTSPAPGGGIGGDGRRRSVAGKGKDVERFHDREQGFKLVKTTYSEPINDDLTNSDGAGAGGASPPLHLHEHHIHYHYYCQHCPPLSQSNLDGIGEMEDCYGDRVPPAQVLRHSEGTVADAAAAARPFRRSSAENGGGAEFCTSPIDFGRHGFAPIGSPLEDSTATTAPALVKKNKKRSLLGTMTMTSSMRRRFFAEQNQEQKQQQSPVGPQSGHSNGYNFYDRGQQQVHGTQRHQVSPILTMGFEKTDGRGGGYGSSSFATVRGKSNQRRRVSLANLGLTDQFADDDDEEQRRRRQQHMEFYDEYEEEFGTSSSNGRQQQQPQSPSPDGNPLQQRAKFLSRLKQFLLRPSPLAKNYSSTPPPPISAPATNSGNFSGTSSGRPYSSSSSSSAFMNGVGSGSGSAMQDAGATTTGVFTSHPTDI